ncbi:MAG: diguanylate cyclase [Archangium sp.]|nr:diguanylate cyclase [Archangium sp.]
MSSWWTRVFPPAEPEIGDAVVRQQHAALRDNMPLLHAVAALNLVIVDSALWADGFPFKTWAWTGLLFIVSLTRIVQWRSRVPKEVELAEAAKQLRTAERLMLVVCSATSGFAVWATATKFFSSSVLVPISLVFGSLCLAHAMSALPRAAVTAVIVGIVPAAIAMLTFGDGLSRLLGFSALSVSALQLSFLRRTYGALLDLMRLQKRMSDMASFDSLTGLLSRRVVLEEIAARLERKQPFALAMVDLDGFKTINDTRGHAMGDALLRAVSKRFMACGDAVGRLGGDEFVVLVDGVADDAACMARMDQILAGAKEPVIVGGTTLQVSASIGYALSPRDGTEPGTLMRAADEAMYEVKHSGKARVLGHQRSA